MKIIIATPLYPPEIAEPAPYTKELAKRLAKDHEVTVIAYTHIPEKVPGVKIIAINKHWPLLIRLLNYIITLTKASRHADVIYVQNGASTELPAGIASLITRRPFIIHLIDEAAHKRAAENKILRYIERFAQNHSRKIITEMPRQRPEILPFESPPDFTAYNKSWNEHILILQKEFNHAR